MIETPNDRRSGLRRFGVLFAVGFLGIAALVLTALRLDPSYAQQAEQLGIPLATFAMLTAVQSSVMLAVSVQIGLYCAPRVGLRSHLHDRVSGGPSILARLRPELRPALLAALAIGALLLIADRIAPAPLEEPAGIAPELLLRSLPVRLLYGGITEELLLRWGIMSLLAFILWRFAGRRGERPPAWVAWSAIVVAAVLFGILHLPAATAVYALSAYVVTYIVGLNAIGGIVFGWVFWRQSLEAAMVAHGGAHLVALSGWMMMAGFG